MYHNLSSTVKHCWQQLGTELSRLADHHSSKAEGYLTPVRIKLQTLLPKLEEMRLKVSKALTQHVPCPHYQLLACKEVDT